MLAADWSYSELGDGLTGAFLCRKAVY